ncbi:hypothetical protein Ocin01_10360 [Orchesella cincta]|uniref:Fe2OG dioxygenase domain-containing protein n=1 Tax=Orchesella cincta TaxID=48709 RepID=A0A1D2MT92_ORCCI|nr:hypothetical protein Ocin01_10360 [Orchesella cincta]
MITSIPIVDIGKISVSNSKPSDWEVVAEEIRKALHEVGFMYLINHGIPSDVIAANFEISEQFFSLPKEIKRKYKKNMKESRNGWVEPGEELLHPDSTFEYRECFDITSRKKFYPTDIPSFRPVHRRLESDCQKVIKNLLKLLAISLKLEDPEFFIKRCCHLDVPEIANECDFSMIFYPPILSETILPPGTVRCAEHTDYEIITLLFQNRVGGLEIKTANGEWISADPIPDAILVITGDLLEMWTNKYYPATLHRVVIPKTESERKSARYSFAYFIAPDSQVLIKPLKSEVIAQALQKDNNSQDCDRKKNFEEESQSTVITAYEHIMERVKTAYGIKNTDD